MSEIKDYPPYLDYPKPRRKQTNADKIRSMTDEELVSLLVHFPCPPNRHGEENGRSYTECPTDETIHSCRECVEDWLKQEVEE